MKADIHPETREVLFYDATAQAGWVLLSTVQTSQTKEWTDGKEYPLFNIEISSASHPFYTGKQSMVSTEGRVSKFRSKYGRG